MTHDTLSVSSVSGINYQTPPELGNSTVLYLGTDSNGFHNPFALFKGSNVVRLIFIGTIFIILLWIID